MALLNAILLFDILNISSEICYNLVVAGPLGMPTEQSTINGALKQLIEKNNLPKVVFHSFRHSSITYKLKLNGGDIKSVQGDSGHAQASMGHRAVRTHSG